MSDFWIFIWGILAFFLAVGSLMAAASLDYQDRGQETTSDTQRNETRMNENKHW